MNDELKIHKITLAGLVVNLVLALVKALVGMVSGSIALIADAIHSLSDLATDGVVFIGVKFGAKPADDTHPYGHGKIETMAALVIAGILVSAGAAIAWKAGQAFIAASSVTISWAVLATAGLSVGLKEWLFRKTLKVARQTHSSALKANAWHHRTDALSSLVVFIGAVAVMCWAGLMGTKWPVFLWGSWWRMPV
ncbi:cation diffusion facilitator family transporter [bacterium]|nr:cation diffusion facilitator family transporter [bacterium]